MIKHLESFIKQVALIIDIMMIVAAFLCTYYLRQHLDVLGTLKPFEYYLWLLLLLLPMLIGILYILGGYYKLRTKSKRQIIWILFQSHVLAWLLFGSIVFILRLHYVSRSFAGFFFTISFVFLSLVRSFFIVAWKMASRQDYFHRNLLIVGTGRRAHALIKIIQNHKGWNLKIMGLVDQERELVGKDILGIPIIGTIEQLPELIREQVIDEVIFVVPRNWMSRLEEVILECERTGVRTTIAVDLFDMRFAKPHLSDMDGIPLLSFHTTTTDQWQLAIKRVLDIILSAIGLILLSPLFLIVSWLIKKNSPGAVFFKQTRCGLNGRRFTLYKFRSMVADAESRLKELKHLNEMSGPVFKAENDPRLTSIGSFIRRTSIDELPQLLNVIKGEMSLVGPRPPVPDEVAQYQPWQRRRLSMRPGITGNWQVKGRNKIRDFDVWTGLDLDYIDQWSLLLDLEILLKTIPIVLFGIGAK